MLDQERSQLQAVLEHVHISGHLHPVWQLFVLLQTLFEKISLLTSNLAGGLDRQQGLVPPVTPGGCPSLSGLIPLEDEAVGWVHSILASQDPPNLNQVSYFPSSLQGCLF